mmetsp:Transcript_14508/g.26940  ORF Transcript_14508/g.26940 Transcript_14508/m.26940 type:complete len:779 (-) Transcript_14508:227-2563(-)
MELVAELVGHQGDIRCICVLEDGRIVSGSRDRLAKIWAPVNEGKAYVEEKTLYDHEHWVSGLMTLPDGNGFVTGSQDNKIRWYNTNGELICTLSGHKGPVTSFSWNYKTNELVSGSWDGTARTWSLDADAKIGTPGLVLDDHENGACVLALPSGDIVTGSAGIQADNKITGFQLRLWKNGKETKKRATHSGAIRALALGAKDGSVFGSVSNDGTLRIWSSETFDELAVMSNPLGPEGSPAFNFSLGTLASFDAICVASDDCCVRVWDTDAGTVSEEVPHPCTVWCVNGLPNGDMVTGASDGYIRVFSRHDERKAPAEVRQNFLEVAHQSRQAIADKASNGGKKVDPEKLAKIYDAPPGNADGDVKMFNKDGVAWVYQWSGDTGAWCEVGEVMGDAGKEELDGEVYDRVIPVELEDPSTGGIRKLKLGMNNGDNPYLLAQQFVEKNGLSDNHVEEIANFIQGVAGQQSTPTIDMSGGAMEVDQGGSGTSAMEVDPPGARSVGPFPLPTLTGLCFDTVNLSKVMEKFLEFNAVASPPLSEDQVKHLQELVGVLGNTSRYHASTVPSKGIDALVKALEWGPEHVFPVLDLVRITVTHPDGSQKLCALKQVDLLAKALELGSSESATLAVALLGARTAANLFRHKDGAESGCSLLLGPGAKSKVVAPLRQLAGYPNKNVRQAVATTLLNATNALYHVAGPREQAAKDIVHELDLIAIDLGKTCSENSELESLRRCLLALGSATKFGQHPDASFAEKARELALSSPESNAAIKGVRDALLKVV